MKSVGSCIVLLALSLTAAEQPLAKGVYAILGEGPTREGVRTGSAQEVILVYNQKYSQADKDKPPVYVAIDTSSFVPLILAKPPEATKDTRGWTLLSVTLAPEHAKTLEAFTRVHLGGRVAIVIDGEIVTMHKVRSVIQDGQVQITRCEDDACQVLRRRLVQ
jgi:preprotein translocase subunit SecD